MIKKMYAILDKKGKFLIFKGLPAICKDENLALECCEKGETVKPVWVTDQDPHENVGKALSEGKEVIEFFAKRYSKNVQYKIFSAIQKDLKNWDEGAG